MAQLRIDATDFVHVKILADAIRWSPASDHPRILAVIYALDLMRPRQRSLRALFWLLRRTRGPAGLHLFFMQLQRKSPQAIRQWIEDASHHVTEGEDFEDANSIGGWSQREIDLLQSRIRFGGLEANLDARSEDNHQFERRARGHEEPSI